MRKSYKTTKELHGADWLGIKEPYQLALTPSALALLWRTRTRGRRSPQTSALWRKLIFTSQRDEPSYGTRTAVCSQLPAPGPGQAARASTAPSLIPLARASFLNIHAAFRRLSARLRGCRATARRRHTDPSLAVVRVRRALAGLEPQVALGRRQGEEAGGGLVLRTLGKPVAQVENLGSPRPRALARLVVVVLLRRGFLRPTPLEVRIAEARA